MLRRQNQQIIIEPGDFLQAGIIQIFQNPAINFSALAGTAYQQSGSMSADLRFSQKWALLPAFQQPVKLR